MSSNSDDQLDNIAEQLNETGEATVSFDLAAGETLDSAVGLLTALSEVEDLEASEVEMTIRR